MSKPQVIKLFIGSLMAIVGGSILLLVGVIVAAANGAFVMNGPDVVGVRAAGPTVLMVSIILTAALAIVGGILGQFVAWIGAVLNTAHLQDKTWFLVLLLLGLLSFGFVAMLAYLWAGPNGTAQSAPRVANASSAVSTA
jgi:hypothetical protein